MNIDVNGYLLKGGVIAFPTDTVWGLGALPQFSNALFELKQRPRDKHFIIMSNTMENLGPWMKDFPAKAFELAKKYWPGPLTIIGNDDPTFGATRIPNHEIFQNLCGAITGHCLATTSANLSGMPPLNDAEAIRKTFPNIMVIDGDVPKKAKPSTIVKVTQNGIEILRRGSCILT